MVKETVVTRKGLYPNCKKRSAIIKLNHLKKKTFGSM